MMGITDAWLSGPRGERTYVHSPELESLPPNQAHLYPCVNLTGQLDSGRRLMEIYTVKQKKVSFRTCMPSQPAFLGFSAIYFR